VRAGPPSWASVPYSASGATGSVIAGLSLARHLPSAAFLTLTTVCTPSPLPGFFHPGNAHGVPSSGLCSAREARHLSRGRCSLAAWPTVTGAPRGIPARDARLQSLLLPEHPFRGGRNPIAAVALLTSCPSKALRAPGVGQDLYRPREPCGPQDRPGRRELAIATAEDPTRAPMRFRPCGPALRSVAHRASWLSPLRRRRPFWGFSPRPGTDLAISSRCR